MDRVISQEFFVQKELKEPKKGEVVGVWRKQPKDKVISLQKKKKEWRNHLSAGNNLNYHFKVC
jgi:hypothetical protein